MRDADADALEVVPLLPGRFARDPAEQFPPDLVGATIVRIGSPVPAGELEGGGLVIDYRPAGAEAARRLVLEFTEEGMWVASHR